MHSECSRIVLIKRAFANPRGSYLYLKGLLRGTLYIFWYRVAAKRVRIKFPFFTFYKVRIVGPGSVFIDKGCSVHGNVFEGLAITTLSKEASVVIGKECILGGLTIRCRKKVEIGSRTMTANSLVQDGLLCNNELFKSRWGRDAWTNPKGIYIGENVWLGGHCIILGGSTIGDDSVISFGSVSYNSIIKEYSIGLGNLIRGTLPIDRLLLLSERV